MTLRRCVIDPHSRNHDEKDPPRDPHLAGRLCRGVRVWGWRKADGPGNPDTFPDDRAARHGVVARIELQYPRLPLVPTGLDVARCQFVALR